MEQVKTVYHRNRKAFILYLLLLVTGVVTSTLEPTFLSLRTISSMLNQAAPLVVIALGQTFVILMRGIDLSVGPVVSLATVIAATTMTSAPWTIVLGIVVVLGVGTLVGVANGIGITKLRIDPLIATLSTMVIVQGITLFVLHSPGGHLPVNYVQLVTSYMGPVRMSVIYFVIVALLCYLLLNHRKIGRHIYAVGGNEQAARQSGLPVDRVKIAAYACCGFLAAFGGLLMSARLGAGDPLVGNPFTLDAITAVLLGGTPFDGGRGGIGGTVPAALILVALFNMLNFIGIQTNYQFIVTGAILILATLLYSFRSSA